MTSPYVVHVPTDAQIGTARARIAAAGLRPNPIGENLLKFYPTDPSGNINVSAPNISNMNTFSVKLDHQLNASNLVNERVFYGRNFQSAPAGNSGEIVPPSSVGPVDLFNSVTNPTIASLVGVVWNSTLSSRTLLETRFGFNYFSQTIEPNNKIDPQSLGINTGPLDAADLGVPGVTTPFGHIGGIAGYPITTAPTTTTQLSMALTHTRGAQTIKLGGSYDYAYNRSVRNQARTSLTANGSTTSDVDALVGLLLARFESASRSFGETERHMTQKSVGLFINDEWKATGRLTLTAGLRYEVFTPVSERDNLATNFFPDRGLVQLGTNGLDQLYNADKNNFGPRAGLAWDVTGDGRTSVRAGYALTYDAPQMGVVHPGLFSTPTLGVFRVSFAQSPRIAPDNPGVRCLDPNNSAAGGDYVCLQPGVPAFGNSPTGAPPFNIFRVPEDFQLGRYHYFHLTVQREVLGRNSVTASYVGSRGQGLVWRKEINAPPLGSPTANSDQFRPFFGQYPQFRSIFESRMTASRGTTACSCRSGRTVARDQLAEQLHAVEVHRLQLGQSRHGRRRATTRTTRPTAKGRATSTSATTSTSGAAIRFPGPASAAARCRSAPCSRRSPGVRSRSARARPTTRARTSASSAPTATPIRSTTGISATCSPTRTRRDRRSPTRRRRSPIRRPARSARAAATPDGCPHSRSSI